MQYSTLVLSLLATSLTTTANPLTSRQTTTSHDPAHQDLYTITLSRTGRYINTPLKVTLNHLTPCDDGHSKEYPSCELTALSVIPGTFHGLIVDDPTVRFAGDRPKEESVQCIGYKDVSGVLAGTARFSAGNDTMLKKAGTGVASVLCYVLPGSE
ncbi:hypothetical protein BJ875DRAFT_440587 [Amylocarpus encephaloides]|uniref:AA1-like domain-containing protein n=1 Tax=Amylocarpus encephaloides TaxID=45428 RepID=A0A9P7YK04_9HELO|nr:hypothetical protein BJ875DRAFT_440587 [Amylocarpus encephaloides]